jgi:hypothetical protein
MDERPRADVELRSEHIVATIDRLGRRIEERFPGAGLGRVCDQLRRLAARAGDDAERLRRPIWPLRLGTWLGSAGIVVVAVAIVAMLVTDSRIGGGLFETLQGSEAAMNVVILLAMAIYFMTSLETRVKRRRALEALHRLRSVVHIVDMHQLTKDPQSQVVDAPTASSPTRTLSAFELGRYLDYCSELFSLASKVAALYVQYLNDPVVLEAVNDVEALGAGLSNKVWQKIVALDHGAPGRPA